MTTATTIIEDALRFGLNRLAVGETLDAETGAVCLRALNQIRDEWNGGDLGLFREILTTSSAITGASGTLGTHWAGLPSGVMILGATYKEGGLDMPMEPLTMQQYHEQVHDKTQASSPRYYAHDGAATVYFWPALAAEQITLRTREQAVEFADLTTDYTFPPGYKAAFSALLAEKVAPTMIGGIPPTVSRDASRARQRLAMRNVSPAIIGGKTRGNILTGW